MNPSVGGRPSSEGRPPAAGSLTEAMVLVERGATPISGGAALMSRAFPGVRPGGTLLDLTPLGLETLAPPELGAGVTLSRLADDGDLERRWPAVSQAARMTANPAVRRLATLGGTVAAKLPTSDLAAALACHGARVEILTRGGTSSLPVEEYWADDAGRGPHLVVGVDLGAPAPGAYRRVAGRHGPAPAIATVAAIRSGNDLVMWAGACGRAPLRVDPTTLATAIPPVSDRRASSTHRARLIRALGTELKELLT